MKTLSALIAAGILTATALATIGDTSEASSREAAQASITIIRDRAHLTHLFGTPWEQALTETVSTLTKASDNHTVVGTKVTWVQGDNCYTAEINTPETPVELTEC